MKKALIGGRLKNSYLFELNYFLLLVCCAPWADNILANFKSDYVILALMSNKVFLMSPL